MLENALPKVAREKQRVGMTGCDGGEEAEFGRAKVLRLINYDMVEQFGGFARETRSQKRKDSRPCGVTLRLQCRAHRSKDRPEALALFGAKSAFAPHALHGDIIIEGIDAPGVNDVRPFGKQEAIRKSL